MQGLRTEQVAENLPFDVFIKKCLVALAVTFLIFLEDSSCSFLLSSLLLFKFLLGPALPLLADVPRHEEPSFRVPDRPFVGGTFVSRKT